MAGATGRRGNRPELMRGPEPFVQGALLMNRFAVPAIVVSIVVFVLAIAGYMLGDGLLPTRTEAVEKGTIAPYYIVWGMIWIVEACAILLAVSLLRTGVRGLTSR
jgi:hypothetical protein